MAFGTGHHGTTLGCLRALDQLVDAGFSPKAVADIGCGTAVLAMASASVWPVRTIASDIDPVAVDVAKANLAANDMTGKIDVVEAVGCDHPDLTGPFDLVLANILKGPLMELAPDFAKIVRPSGFAILSGILVDQAEDVIAHFAGAGFNLDQREDIVDWTTLRLTRNHLNF